MNGSPWESGSSWAASRTAEGPPRIRKALSQRPLRRLLVNFAVCFPNRRKSRAKVRGSPLMRASEAPMKAMSTSRNLVFILALIAVPGIMLAQVPGPAFDIVITNGHIIDGTGSPWYSGDVGIRDGKIAAIGNLTAD